MTSIIEDEDEGNIITNLPESTKLPQKLQMIDGTVNDESTSQLQLQQQLSNQSAEMLRYHIKYGHIPFARIKIMAQQGILPKYLASCPTPACIACMYGRATKRPWRNKSPKNANVTRDLPTGPGECISVDVLTSPAPGFVAQMTGNLTTARYLYATVYVDSYSSMGYLYFQKNSTAEETLKGKRSFEMFANQCGVKILRYHADNGIFRASKWVQNCIDNHQALTFAAVNAHHQNGRAERRIRLLQELTRAQLIHASSKWLGEDLTMLWPYAMRAACESLNHSPNMQDKQKRTPMQLFSNSNVQTHPKHMIPIGAPTFVLQKALQSNLPFSKWRHRAKVGIYLGKSPIHAKSVSLVLDMATGLVSPQFHVAHDISFNTVPSIKTNHEWKIKAGFRLRMKTESPQEMVTPKLTNDPPALHSKNKKRSITQSEKNEGTPNNDKRKPISTTKKSRVKFHQTTQMVPGPQEMDRNHPNKLRRSERAKNPIKRLTYAMMIETTLTPEESVRGEIFNDTSIYPKDCNYMQSSHPLMAYKATSDPDTLYFHEAMSEPDRDQFLKAMEQEVRTHLEKGHISVVPTSKVPEGARILPCVWQLRRKRDIATRTIKKWKARLNVDGSRMRHGIDYDETYAPVATWASIRLSLIFSIIYKWPSRQIDYVQAFPQAPIQRELFVKIPAGYEIENEDKSKFALQVHKNLYGQKQAGRVWNSYLVEKLKELHFEQSDFDECVFYRGNVLYVLYTDDSIIFGKTEKELDDVIRDIKRANLKITEEGNIKDFLGVNITNDKKGSIHLHQPHLVESILKDLRMTNVKHTKDTPAASSRILSRHTSSENFDKSFDYRSVLGKLGYLEKASRPDLSYIVHQCQRFCANPKIEHGKAVRWIGRYLADNVEKGIYLTPDKNKGMEVYVDADFAGNWDPDETHDIDTARSRHGYVIKFANCPIVWKSQLQLEQALSSTESEYTGLSYALREAIPIINLLREMSEKLQLHYVKPKIHCKVYEDNSGALEMAKVHKYRPRTKHLNIRLHHFRSYVPHAISIHKISTTEQEADILTKPLKPDIFTKLRKKIMGW